MGTMNISLPDPMKSWVESQTRTGRFANTSDYMRDLIRRDQARVEVIATLQSAIDQGVQSGDPRQMDTAAFLVRMRDQHGR
jgi:antitoxin ParD1/3/4